MQSVTSVGSQRLLLDRRAMLQLMRQSSAKVVGIRVILTEGHDWREPLGADASLVTALGHIPRFRIAGGLAEPDPAKLARC